MLDVGEPVDLKSCNMEIQSISQDFYPFSDDSENKIERTEKEYHKANPGTSDPGDDTFY